MHNATDESSESKLKAMKNDLDVATQTLEDVKAKLLAIKRVTQHARMFGPDTLANYRRACVSAEGDAEDALGMFE